MEQVRLMGNVEQKKKDILGRMSMLNRWSMQMKSKQVERRYGRIGQEVGAAG